MKIAFVRKSYNPFGGAELFLNQLLEYLLKSGFEIHLFAHQWKPGNPVSLGKVKNIIFHRVPLVKGLSVLQTLSFAYNAQKLLKKEHFDLIHSFERMGYLDVYRAGDGCHRAWLQHRKFNQHPFKTMMTYLNPLHQSILFLERKIFLGKRTRFILCNSQLVKREIQTYYGVPDQKIRVFYNGVDLQRYHPNLREKYRTKIREEQGINVEDLVLLFLGSGFERKGLNFLIKALPIIQKNVKRNVKILVVGKGKVEKYKKILDRIGLRDRILLIGPSKDPLPWYGAADLFVLPTIYDPFSNATLEALASGIPVITTRSNGASELIEGQECGFVLEHPSDFHQLASFVEKLAEDKTREAYGKKAREVANRYPMEGYAEAMISFYQQLLGPPKSVNDH